MIANDTRNNTRLYFPFQVRICRNVSWICILLGLRRRPLRCVGRYCSSSTIPRCRTSATRKYMTSSALIAPRASTTNRKWRIWKRRYQRCCVKVASHRCHFHMVCRGTSRFVVTSSPKTPSSSQACTLCCKTPRSGVIPRTSGLRDLSALMENSLDRRSSFPLASVTTMSVVVCNWEV